MKTKLNKKNSKGFTLIEVVLVLAIGGLIFLLAFLAFQQVSTNRRDTQRRSDAARLTAELENYKGDKGSYPSSTGFTTSFNAADSAPSNSGQVGTFVAEYLGGSNFKNPNGSSYYIAKDAADATIAEALVKGIAVQYGFNQKCVNGAFQANSGSVAILMNLEKGKICRDTLGS